MEYISPFTAQTQPTTLMSIQSEPPEQPEPPEQEEVEVEPLPFYEESLLADIAFSAYELYNATLISDGIRLSPNGWCKVELPYNPEKRFACERLQQVIDYSTSLPIESRYTPTLYSTVSINYTRFEKSDTHLIVLNRDEEVSSQRYINNAIIDTQNREVESIIVTVINRSGVSLDLHALSLHKSMDISPFQIADVLKGQTIVTDVIHANASFTQLQFIQYLRTNVFSIQAIEGVTPATPFSVNFLTAQEDELAFYSTEHSNEEKEHFTMRVGNQDIPFFYAIIGDHPDAYKYITTVDPREKFPSMSDIDYDKFKFYVWKETRRSERGSWRYEDVINPNGQITRVPVLTLGQGYDVDPNAYEGQFKLIKDNTGVSFRFHEKEGSIREIRMDEDGMRIINGDELLAQARLHPSRLVIPETTDPSSEPLNSLFII